MQITPMLSKIDSQFSSEATCLFLKTLFYSEKWNGLHKWIRLYLSSPNTSQQATYN